MVRVDLAQVIGEREVAPRADPALAGDGVGQPAARLLAAEACVPARVRLRLSTLRRYSPSAAWRILLPILLRALFWIGSAYGDPDLLPSRTGGIASAGGGALRSYLRNRRSALLAHSSAFLLPNSRHFACQIACCPTQPCDRRGLRAASSALLLWFLVLPARRVSPIAPVSDVRSLLSGALSLMAADRQFPLFAAPRSKPHGPARLLRVARCFAGFRGQALYCSRSVSCTVFFVLGCAHRFAL